MKKVILSILMLCSYVAVFSQKPISLKTVYPDAIAGGTQIVKTSNNLFFNAEEAVDADNSTFRTAGNDVTKAYSFTPTALDNWGVVGSATPNGWGGGPDLPLTYDAVSNTWSAVVSLIGGEIKFRNNNDWSVNYGDNGGDGTLEANGSNIIITAAGSYLITLDLTTLNYSITSAKTYYVNDNLQAGDIFTTSVGSNANAGTEAAPFATLTYALSQAGEGDTIYVDAGSYTEQLTIDKGIVIIGAGQDLTSILKPAVTAAPPGSFGEQGVIQTAQSITGDVHIRNVSVTGDYNVGVTPVIIQSGGSVKNCRLQGGNQGIFVRIDPAINLATKTFVADGNIINAEFIAVNFAGTRLTATLSNNTIATFSPVFSTGVFAGLDFGTLAGLFVTGNSFSSYVSDGLMVNTNNGNITQNSFLGTGPKAINKIGGSTINATCNWYGTSLQNAVIPKLTAGINYSPWLSNGTDNNVATGFQPTLNVCNGRQNKFFVNDNSLSGDVFSVGANPIGNDNNAGIPTAPLASIVTAYSRAQAGDTIFVDAGTYDLGGLSYAFPKSIAILGTNYQVSPNDATNKLLANTSRNAETILSNGTIAITSNNLSFEGITFNPGNRSLITLSAADYDNFNFTKNKIIISTGTLINLSGTATTDANLLTASDYMFADNRFEKLATGSGSTFSLIHIKNTSIDNNAFVVTGPTARTQNTIIAGNGGIVDNLTVTNNVIDRPNYNMFSSAVARMTITGNKFYNAQRGLFIQAVYAGSTDIRIEDNLIEHNLPGLAISDIMPCRIFDGANAANSNISIRNNTININGTGLTSLPPAISPLFAATVANPSLVVSGNRITHTGSYNLFTAGVTGIALVGKNSNTTVENNEIQFTGQNIPLSFVHSGISTGTDGVNGMPASSVMNFRNNKVSGYKQSIIFYDGTSTAADTYIGYGNLPIGATVNIHNNSFTGDSISINNGNVGQSVNASCNWYGSINANIVLPKIGKNVIYNSWLTTESDGDVAIGFQPSGSCNGRQNKFYVNDNSLTGDVFSTGNNPVGNDANPGIPSAPLLTIGAALTKASAGDTIYVDAGTYAERVIVNKSVYLKGAYATVNPGSSLSRGVSESILIPSAENNILEIMTIQSPNVTVDGFLFNGDNPSITGSITLNGVDVNAGMAIYNGNLQTDSLVVKNNIMKNFYRYAVLIQKGSAPVTIGNNITQNRIDNISSRTGRDGRAIAFFANSYGAITNNAFTRVHAGVFIANQNTGTTSDSLLIANNTIEAYNAAISFSFVNNQTSPIRIKDNQLSLADLSTWVAPGSSSVNNANGISMGIVSSTKIISLENNTITGFRNGINPSSINTPDGLLISGGSISNSPGVAVFYNGQDPATAKLTLNNLSLQNNDVGIDVSATDNTNMPVEFSGVSISGGSIGLRVYSPKVTLAGNTLTGISFANQSNSYIMLTYSAFTGLTIDATSVSFDGLTGASMTLAQRFAVENKIVHRIDYNGGGFIRIKANEAYVTPNSFIGTLPASWGTPTTTPDINRAIAAVATNDTIHVDAGTYTPGNFTIDKSITILGSNYLITPNNPSDKLLYNSSRNPESIISNSIITFAADNINIEGFQFNTPTSNQFTLSSTAVTNDLCKNIKLLKNRFVSTTTASNLFAFFGKAGTLITGGYIIDDNRIEEGAGASMRLSNLTDVTITNNSFVRSTIPIQGGLVAIRPQGPITNLIAENNTIQNWDVTLIQAAPIKNLVYNNNNLISCQRCILLNSVDTEPGTLSITNNIITQHSTASAPVISVVRSTALNAVSPNFITIDNNSITKIAGAQTFTLFPLIDLICNNSAGTGDPLSSNFQVSIKGNKLTYGGNMSSATTPNPYGLQFSGKMAITTIENNEIIFTGTNLLLPAPNSPLRPTGIFINNSGSILPGAAINILNNKIQGFKHSVAFFNSTSSSHGGLVNGVTTTISNNSFTGDELSVNNGTSGQAVNATCNWYGVNSAQDVSNKITPSTVNAISWLTNGTDVDLAIGFQPVPGSCDGSLPLITLNSSTNVTCNGTSNGTINITTSYGKAPFTYTWTKEGDVNFVSHNEDPTGLAPGVYHLVIVDANGSNIYDIDPQTSTPGTVVVTITEPTVLTAAISNTSTACSNIATVTAGGGTTGYTYLWSNGSTATTISGVPLGTYIVTVTDANGCTVTATVTLTVAEAFNPSASVTNVTCFGANNGIITVTNANGTAPFMFSKDGGITFTAGTLPYSFTNLAPGTYNIAVKDNGGCTGFVEKIVIQPTQLTATINTVQSTCFGQSNGAVTATVAGGVAAYTYSWTKVGGGFSSSQLNISNLAAGVYTLTVTDKNNCSVVVPVTVNPFPAIVIPRTIADVACKGGSTGSINITATGGSGSGFTYSWTGAIISSNEDLSNIAKGTYKIRVTDIGSGCFVDSTFIVTEPGSNISLTTSRTNATGCSSLGTATGTGSGGTAPYTYNINGGVYQGSGLFTGLYAGSYTIGIMDARGCTTTKVVTITDNGADEYEGTGPNKNNTRTKAFTIPIENAIYARIPTVADSVDWYKFTTAGAGDYTVTFSHPNPAIVFHVYSASGTDPLPTLPGSTATSKKYNLSGATVYNVRVNGGLSFICYSLKVSSGIVARVNNNQTQVTDKAPVLTTDVLKAITYPNPHNGNFTLSIESPEEGVATIEMFTVNGQKLSERKANVVQGKGNTVKYSNMNYAILFYKVSIGKHVATGKIISPN